MNQKIQELSDIAYRNHLKNNPNSSFGRRADYDKEFAELIIRECIANIENCDGDLDFAIYKTKKDFGVE